MAGRGRGRNSWCLGQAVVDPGGSIPRLHPDAQPEHRLAGAPGPGRYAASGHLMTALRRATLAGGVVMVFGAALAVAAVASAQSPLIDAARLEGAYRMNGVITKAVGVPG